MTVYANDVYSVGTGQGLYLSRSASSVGVPLWAAAAVTDKAMAIPNTAGFGGGVGAFSGWAHKNGEVILGLDSGHSAGFYNGVTSLNYMVDSPAWAVRMTPSVSTSPDTPYYPDGKPASRHVYQMSQYVSGIDRVVWAGVRFTNPNANTFTNADAFNLSNNTWESAGYIGNVPGLNGGGVIDYDGIFHTGVFSSALNNTTKQWVSGTVSGASGYTGYQSIRHPWATDSAGRKVFGIAFGDGEGFNPELGVRASVMRNNVVYPVTITPSAALTQFTNDTPFYCGMDYDQVNGWFLYVDIQHRRFYKITVANDNTATMAFYTPDLSAVTLPVVPIPVDNTACTNTRVSYNATLKGFIIGCYGVNVIFIKTA